MSSVLNNLFGTYLHKMDPKNRVSIPSEWRPEEGCSLLLLAGRRVELPTIKVYTRQKFLEIVEKVQASTQYSEAQIDLYLGKLFANCEKAEVNSQGKLLIPRNMCEHANLSCQIRLAGRGGYFELWEPQAYQEARTRENDNTIDINTVFGIF